MIMDKNKQFELIRNFVSNIKDKKNGVSNVYIFETVDRDGNTTDIKYGMNLMTNNGFNKIYKQNTTFALSNSVHLYVGEGSDPIVKTMSTMTHVLFGGLAATNDDTAKDFAYPIMYHPGQESNTGLITLISRFGIVYYDYNITNYDYDAPITEYGIGTSSSDLWTYSHIYDMNGDKGTIVKKPNEKMTIYIYTCLSLYENVIMDSWAKNIFIGLTTNQIMFQRMRETDLRTYKRNNSQTTRNDGKQFVYDDTLSQADIDAGIDSIIRNYITMGPFTIWAQEGAANGYIDGFIFYATGCMIINPEYMPQPEDVVLNDFTSNDITKASGFSDRFGVTVSSSYNKNTYPPFTTLSDITVNTFNYNTGEFDNPCPFDNDNNMQYSNAGMETSYAIPIYYFANGQIQTAYLYQNINPSNPILSVAQGQAFLVATDKYWDQSTWITITDMTNIPVAARQCKYWIAGSNSAGVIPTRQTHPFELLESVGGTNGYTNFVQGAFNTVHQGLKPYADMHDYNCAVVGGKICALNRLRGYDFGDNSYQRAHMSYGKWLISFGNVNNNVNTIDVSTLNNSEPDTSVLTVTRNLGFSSNVNTYTQTYRTESGTGIICVQATTLSEAAVLKLGSTITSNVYPWMRSCSIYGTSLIAYIPTTDTTNIHIFDTTLSTDVGNVIPLPTDYTPYAMFGNNNHLWFYDNTTTYHVDISSTTRDLEVCDKNLNWLTYANSHRLRFANLDDMLVAYDYSSNNYTFTDMYLILNNTPTHIGDLSAFSNNTGFDSSSRSRLVQLRYVNTNSLYCSIQTGEHGWSPAEANKIRRYYCDLGRYLKTGTAWMRYTSIGGDSNNAHNGTYFYGEKVFDNAYRVFPAVNMMEIKLTGKTRTITTFNHTKRISNKQFELGFTNIPTWGYEINGSGKVPGEPHPILNGQGQIVDWGWS